MKKVIKPIKDIWGRILHIKKKDVIKTSKAFYKAIFRLKSIPMFLISLMMVSEVWGRLNAFNAAIFYSIWLLASLIILIHVKFDKNLKNFCIAFMAIPAMRIMQFLAPMNMISNDYQILVKYSVLFIASWIYAKHMDINLFGLHNLKGGRYLIPVIPLALVLSSLGILDSSVVDLSFSYAGFFIVLFASYVQLLFIFGILQNNLQEYQKVDSTIPISLIAPLLLLNHPSFIITTWIMYFIFSIVFYRTKNLNLLLIPSLILNFIQFMIMPLI